MTYLVLVRHAATQIDPEVHPRDWVLSYEGVIQATQLVEAISDLEIQLDQLHCSTEPKTSLTLGPLNEQLEMEIRTDPAFDETHLPFYVEDSGKWMELKRQQLTNPGFEGERETSEQALARFEEGIMQLNPEQIHLICSHGTIMSLFMARLRGRLWTRQAFDYWRELDFTAIEIIDIDEARALLG